MHLIRDSLSFCNWKESQPVARELKRIYNAKTAEAAAKRLEDFVVGPWEKRLPAIAQSWRTVWGTISAGSSDRNEKDQIHRHFRRQYLINQEPETRRPPRHSPSARLI
jgi:transposase-like protein